jgi:hypothetical protein
MSNSTSKMTKGQPSPNGHKKDELDILEDWTFVCATAELANALGTCTPAGLNTCIWPEGRKLKLKPDVTDKNVIIVSGCDKPSLLWMSNVRRQLKRADAAQIQTWCLHGLGVEFETLSDWREHFDLGKQLALERPWLKRWDPPEEPAQAVDEKPSTSEKSDEKQSQALMRLADSAKLFHNAEPRAYAVLPINGHHEVHAVHSHGFRLWLGHQFFKAQGKPASSNAFQEVLSLIEARAIHDGQEEEVYIRVAGDADRIFVDLGEPSWSVVEITSEGWDFARESPVRFRRTSGQRPLPSPIRGGNINALRDFVNCKDEDFILLVAWLGAALRPVGPYPVLVLTGEQGSAKSSLARALRKLIDNHVSLIRAAPEKERDLAVSASNGHVFALDNLSSIPHWLSDALCRLATGGGIANRTHYTMDEETYLDSQRPIILTGIEDFVTRGDLISRSLPIHLPAIADGHRKTEKAFWAEFDAASPLLVGSLFDVVAGALHILPQVAIATLPRMADFALFGEAISRAMGNPPDTFVRHYGDARLVADQSAVEDSSVATAMKLLMERRPLPWESTAAQLLKDLTEIIGEKESSARAWPKTPRGMGGALRRLAPLLRKTENINLDFDRDKKQRSIVISLIDPA